MFGYNEIFQAYGLNNELLTPAEKNKLFEKKFN